MSDEGEVKKADAGSMKPGSYIIMDSAACKVVDIQISRPGKHGHAKARIEAVGILDGKKKVIAIPGTDSSASTIAFVGYSLGTGFSEGTPGTNPQTPSRFC